MGYGEVHERCMMIGPLCEMKRGFSMGSIGTNYTFFFSSVRFSVQCL